MLSLVGYIRTEVPTHEAMPISVILPIELIFKMRGDFLDSVHFFKSIPCNCDDFCFHFGTDISALDDRFSLSSVLHAD